jgi:ribonucleoside-diphosphate reductase alpha chain
VSVDIRVVSKSASGASERPRGGSKRAGSDRGSMSASIDEQGIRIARRFTRVGVDPLDEIAYELRDSVITNPDGSVVFEMRGAEIPESWSQLATDIAVSKYFRKAGIKGDAESKTSETSARQLVVRVAKTLREAGEQQGGYFASTEDADAFEAELSYLLITQRAAFNSPVWFNLGLYQRYGIEGQGGNWAYDFKKDDVVETTNAYERPQCSACFIQSVGDDLMSIYDLVKTEARLFKYGSGTGTNFSHLRGRQEKLSGGGTSSGLMSFLEVLDRAAGATKSGGTTRRAAKMVCLDMDHPEIVDFIEWKVREEKKARALIAAGYASDFNGDAYHTVSGQNSNNSVRVSDEFMRAVEQDGEWQTTMRTTGEVVDTYKARDLWRKVADSAWHCADPGVQYDTTINAWHTSPNTDRINASNPCSEYMFLDDTACNLSSINLVKFLDEDGKFDVEGYRHAIKILLMSQEILVDHSSYPTKRVAKNSHDYRPLGLGYANLGTLLMRLGIAYDSDLGRGWCGALTAILTGHAYRTSAEMAATKGPFPGFTRNRMPMLRVMNKHREMANSIDRPGFPGTIGRGDSGVPSDVLSAAREDWEEAYELGEKFGYRNAQATVLAPTGTIGLLMDCDTTGIEPDFALVKFKKLAGGGYFKIVNQSVPDALRNLGYSPAQIADIVAYVSGTNTFTGAPYLTRSMLIEKGLTESELAKAEKALPGVFDASQALGPWVIGTGAYERLGLRAEQYNRPGFSLLKHFGLTNSQIDELNDVVIGRMTIEGGPHLRHEHYSVFDCANRCGKHSKRYIEPMAHVRMMAAAQPFLSGAISKTVNLPNEATVEEVERVYFEGWKLGLKAIALYRDGCKASQPLSSGNEKEEKKGDAKSDKLAASPALVPTVVNEPVRPRVVDAAKSPPVSVRHRMSKRRKGFTQEARIAGHKVFLRTGEYEDGSLGEIFIDMHKEGAAFRSLMNCFAISVSMGLQHGVPLSSYVDQFTFTRFEPGGLVEGHPNIKFSTSIIDYVFRVLGVEYLRRYDFAQVPPDEVQMELQNPTDADAVNKLPMGAPASTPPEAITKAPQIELTFAGGDPAIAARGSVLDQQLGEMMGDAPMCDQCGHITVRNGACYKCLNCGASLGCS